MAAGICPVSSGGGAFPCLTGQSLLSVSGPWKLQGFEASSRKVGGKSDFQWGQGPLWAETRVYCPTDPKRGGGGGGAEGTASGHWAQHIRSTWAKAQNGPRGQLPDCCMSLHLVDL